MGTVVNIQGEVVAPESAKVSVFDRGFLYGDSVYEVIRTYQGEPFELEVHLERLRASGQRIGLAFDFGDDVLAAQVRETIEASGNTDEGRESYVRVMVTRGEGDLNLDPASAHSPTRIIIVRPLEQPPRACYQEGVEVSIVGVPRNLVASLDPAAKTGNYLNNLLALREAREKGAFEAVMLDAAGRIAEGSTSNLFLVRHGALYTPALEIGILEGVTRRTVLACARDAGLVVDEGVLGREAFESADEAFLTSSIREIVPITRVDGAPVGDGTVGPVTRALWAAFRARTGVPLGGDAFGLGE